MKLLIAIPALNEEGAIAGVIERCLAARSAIITGSPVTEVDITVVSDGSTDRTAELASVFADRIHVTVFEANRGYGAAIKTAWRDSDAELLGVMDGAAAGSRGGAEPLVRSRRRAIDQRHVGEEAAGGSGRSGFPPEFAR